MKAELIKAGLMMRNPEYDSDAARKAHYAGERYAVPFSVPAPVGTVIDHPDAWRLVRSGVAVPADVECEAAAGMTADEMRAAQAAHERVARGIHPDDFDAYEAGLMNGYDGDGFPTLDGVRVNLEPDPLPLED